MVVYMDMQYKLHKDAFPSQECGLKNDIVVQNNGGGEGLFTKLEKTRAPE